MRDIKLFLLFFYCSCTLTFSQTHTVGTITYDPSGSYAGYNLFFPHRQGTVFLIDACGQVVHNWPDTGWEPGEAVKLMEDGSIYIAKSRGDLSNPWIQGGGAGEKIEHRDWDNNLLWTYTWNDSLKRMHHDFEVMPNGNIVIISWEWKTQAESIAQGRDTSLIPVGFLLPDYLIELQPVGIDSASIVWEWHAWDHLIQDFDSTKQNYGVVGDHPELIDFNFTNPQSTSDWLHFNTVTYNSVLDMLMISTPTFNEVWMIDHSTTTAEAASHAGGHSGKGGDLVYRWGNPRTYRRGTIANKKLFFQHTPYWLSETVLPADPYYNGIGIFNNQVTQTTSTANIFTPVFDSLTWSFQMQNGRYLPVDFDWTYSAPDPAMIHSAVVSNMQRLANGNTLIFAGRIGTALEIDSQENPVWNYKVPFNLGQPVTQGDNIPMSGNLCFRMLRYAPDFPGFAGRDLTPQGYIELNPDTAFCDTLFQSNENSALSQSGVTLYPVPAVNEIYFSEPCSDIIITNSFGQVMIEQVEKSVSVICEGWPAGIYFVRCDKGVARFVLLTK